MREAMRFSGENPNLAVRLPRGIDLIVADMGTEPVTQNGVSRMFFGMLALVAEFERERIKEQSAEGCAAKRPGPRPACRLWSSG